jgi:site-specific recombinase XerD
MYAHLPEKVNKTFSVLPERSRILVVGYLTHLINRRFSPVTVRGAIYHLKVFCEYLPDESRADLCQVRYADIRGFIEYLHGRDLCAVSINGYLSIIRGFFRYLIDEDYLGKNPVLRRYFLAHKTYLPRPMHEADLPVFLAQLITPRDRAVFLLMLRCGLRVGEVCRLQMCDIDWDRKSVIVHNGKGRVDRVVYMSHDAEEALRRWLAKRGYMSPYCFVSPYKANQPLSPRMIQLRMHALLRSGGLDGKGYTPHTLRHTFATLLLNAGMDLYVLKDLMGHKKVDQTLMYARLSNRRIHEQYHRAMQQVDNELEWLKEGVG